MNNKNENTTLWLLEECVKRIREARIAKACKTHLNAVQEKNFCSKCKQPFDEPQLVQYYACPHCMAKIEEETKPGLPVLPRLPKPKRQNPIIANRVRNNAPRFWSACWTETILPMPYQKLRSGTEPASLNPTLTFLACYKDFMLLVNGYYPSNCW